MKLRVNNILLVLLVVYLSFDIVLTLEKAKRLQSKLKNRRSKHKMGAKTREVWKWESLKGSLVDIATNSYKDVVGVGQDGKVYGYDRELKRWKEYPGDIKDAVSITLSSRRRVYICTKNKIMEFIPPDFNEQYKGTWKVIPGCCRDIAVNSGGLLVSIGCDKHTNGYGIWRNLGGNRDKWKRVFGQAEFVGVGSQGHIVVSNNKNEIYWKENVGSKWILATGKATDVTVGVGGRMVVIGMDKHIYYSSVDGARPQWVQTSGMGSRLSCWSWRNPVVVGTDKQGYEA